MLMVDIIYKVGLVVCFWRVYRGFFEKSGRVYIGAAMEDYQQILSPHEVILPPTLILGPRDETDPLSAGGPLWVP